MLRLRYLKRVFLHFSSVITRNSMRFQKNTCAFNFCFSCDQIEAAIHSSNVMLYSKEKQVASRVGHKILEDGTRVRYLIKTGEVIDNAENWKKVTKERTKAKE